MKKLPSEKTVGMRLALPASWNKKLKMMSVLSGDSKAGARTEVMKAVEFWIRNTELPNEPKKNHPRPTVEPPAHGVAGRKE